MLNSQRVVTSSNASSGTCSGHAPAVSSRHLPRYKVHSRCSQLNNSSCCSSGGKCKPVVSCESQSWACHWQSWPQQWRKVQCIFSVWYELIHTYTHKRNYHKGCGGSVNLTCQRGKGGGKQCDQVHFERYLQLCTEINHLSKWKRWASK